MQVYAHAHAHASDCVPQAHAIALSHAHLTRSRLAFWKRPGMAGHRLLAALPHMCTLRATQLHHLLLPRQDASGHEHAGAKCESGNRLAWHALDRIYFFRLETARRRVVLHWQRCVWLTQISLVQIRRDQPGCCHRVLTLVYGSIRCMLCRGVIEQQTWDPLGRSGVRV